MIGCHGRASAGAHAAHGCVGKRGRNFECALRRTGVLGVAGDVMSGAAATTHGSYELGPRYEQLPALKNVPTLQRYFKKRLHDVVRRQGSSPRFQWPLGRRH